MAKLQSLDANELAPFDLRQAFKRFRQISTADLNGHPEIIDLQIPQQSGFYLHDKFAASRLQPLFQSFCGKPVEQLADVPIYGHSAIPGLYLAPSLFPPPVQQDLISRLVHRDLSDSRHKTNLHLHYDVPYPSEEATSAATPVVKSFFSYLPSSSVRFLPKDPKLHRPLSISQVLHKKLRWITLGGQYDWTEKIYPAEKPPDFPRDIQLLIQELYPEIHCQAAIVNFYSPGDTLSPHRDVSERCDNGLVSVSFGCDCLFMIALSQGDDQSGLGSRDPFLVMRLRSGDSVFMSEAARRAWHGVPKVIPDSCPAYLENWPDDQFNTDKFEQWRGWMSSKRINLNIRQMEDST